jgi:Icc-related predicted phosphoesterase
VNVKQRIFLIFLVIILILSASSCGSPKKSPSPLVKEEPPPQTVESPQLKFAVFGDNRPASAILPPGESFKKLLTQITKERVDFMFSVGDMVFGSPLPHVYEKQYGEFAHLISETKIPFYAAPGNHDLSYGIGVKLFKSYIYPRTYYSFSYKNCYFIFLNTEEERKEGKIEGKQLAWLKEELKKAQGKIIFVFLHRPPYSVLNPEGNPRKHIAFTDKENEVLIRNLFEGYQVKAVFAGHEHFFHYEKHNGVDYFITGCSGSPPYAPEEKGGFPHFLLVEVFKDHVKYTVVKENGERFEVKEAY